MQTKQINQRGENEVNEGNVEDRKWELEEYGIIPSKSVDGLFNYKVSRVHCGKIKIFKKQNFKSPILTQSK